MADRITPPSAEEIFDTPRETRNAKLDVLSATDEPSAIADALREIADLQEQRAVLMDLVGILKSQLDASNKTNRDLQVRLREALALAKDGQ